jgi:hypothetical protein
MRKIFDAGSVNTASKKFSEGIYTVRLQNITLEQSRGIVIFKWHMHLMMAYAI